MEDSTKSYACGHCTLITFSKEKQYWIFLMSGPIDSATSGSGSSRKALTSSSNLRMQTETLKCKDFLISYGN